MASNRAPVSSAAYLAPIGRPVPFTADIFDALPAAIYTTDADGRVTSFNKACVSFSGRIPELGTDRWCVTWKLFRSDGTPLPFDECPMAVALKEGRTVTGAEAIAERPDGTRIWFAAHPTPLFDESGGLIGGVNMLVDITARKEVELSLARGAREQGALYRFTDRLQRAGTLDDIHDAALDAIIEGLNSDRAAILLVADGVMRFAASRGLSGEYRAAVEGHSPWALDDPAPQHVTIADVPASDLDEHLKSVIAREGIEAVGFFPLVSAGRLIGKFMVYYDAPHEFADPDIGLAVTIARQLVFALDRHGAEQERRATSEALREADRRKDEFLATLAHELRNPLAPIHSALPLLEMGLESGQEADRWLEIINRQTGRLTRLVDDLMDVSRITRGHVELRMQELDIVALVSQAIDAHTDELRACDLIVVRHLPDDEVIVEGDPVRLEQIVSNLLSNAIKYTDAGGTVTVGVTRAEGMAELTVRDTGIGIDTAFLPQMFTLFEQADRTLDRSKGGLGIGLTLARQLVELHGGTIAADSAGAGEGSTFTVRIPIIESASGGREALSGASDHEGGDAVVDSPARILIVDDNADYAEVLGELVSQLGHEVHLRHDGVSALRLAETISPDLVFLDIGLPGLDGYEVAKRLRRSPATSEAHLVALTGYGQPADRERSAGAGFNAHVVKPIEVDALSRLIASATARDRGPRSA